jgi:hypothetical protein
MTRKQLSKLETIRLKLVALQAEIGASDEAAQAMSDAAKAIGNAYVTGSTYLSCRGMEEASETWVQVAERQHAHVLYGR